MVDQLPGARLDDVGARDPAKPTVIFLHIPKTGGLTLRRLLRRTYPPQQTYRVGDERQRSVKREGKKQVDNTRLIRYIRDEGPAPRVKTDRNRAARNELAGLGEDRLRNMQLIMGHFWFGLHEAVPQPTRYITMLRHPVDRVLSLYNHRLTRHALEMTIEQYVENARDLAFDNELTRRLVGRIDDKQDVRLVDCTPEMLDTAKRHLDDYFVVPGLTERFDESLVLWGRELGWKSLYYKRENVAGKRLRRSELSAEVLRTIEEHNRYDIQLYDYAKELFEARLSAEPNVERDVKRLRFQNKAYERWNKVTERYDETGVPKKVADVKRRGKRAAKLARKSLREKRAAARNRAKRKANVKSTAADRSSGRPGS